MSKNTKLILSSIYSGVGFGLLLGLIMGLSISPTVKIVMGALTSILGGLLGLENKIGKSESQDYSAIERNMKLGSFGFAVVLGIIAGINIRTHDLFAPSIKESMTKWVSAGYDSASARKYVAYEKLLIDPETGNVLKDVSDIQKKGVSGLFNDGSSVDLSTELDTAVFNGDIKSAKEKLELFEIKALDDLLDKVESNLPKQSHMSFLASLQQMVAKVEKEEKSYCKLSDDITEWNDPTTSNLSLLLLDMEYQSRTDLIAQIKTFFCNIE